MKKASFFSSVNSIIDSLQHFLFLTFPAILFFSYHPRIPLASTETMELELSLPLIYLLFFSASSLIRLPSTLSYFSKNHPKILSSFFILLLFPLYLTLSTFWSANPLRSFLTSGIFWSLSLSSLTIIKLMSNQKTKLKIIKLYLIGSFLVALFCWLTCLFDLLRLPPEFTLLCPGCTYQSFGFPHPNGFAIEPQFMGSLFLAPSLLSLYLSQKRRQFVFLAIFFITTLFLTFSRGAIYALLVAILILICFTLPRLHFTAFRPLLIIIPSLLISLIVQGIFAQLSPTSDNFATGSTKALHHLSLGLIDLRPNLSISPTEQSNSSISENAQNSSSVDYQKSSPSSAIFQGYIAESTDIRLRLTGYAIDLWNDHPGTLLFGVGLGSAGPKLYQKFPDLGSPKEIVQNQYISLLLEVGLIGVILALLFFGLILIFLFRNFFRYQTQFAPFFIALISAYAFTLLFFSGLPNALHLYLLPIYILATSLQSSSERN